MDDFVNELKILACFDPANMEELAAPACEVCHDVVNVKPRLCH